MANIKKSDIEDIYNLAPMQAGMLFHHLLDRNSLAYFTQMTFTIRGVLDPDLFRRSLQLLERRYEVLRTNFVYENLKKPKQVVLKEKVPDLDFYDLSQLDETERLSAVIEYQNKDRERGFDLTRDALLRITVLKTGAGTAQVIWSFHHIIMDGWCLGILLREFFQIYQSLMQGKAVNLLKTTPYSNYIAWLEQQDQEAARAYWKNYLAGYEQKAGLPKRNPRSPEYFQKKIRFNLDEELTQKLEQTAIQHQVTVNTIFQSIWGVLLQKYNRTDDAVFGSVVSGRPPVVAGIEKMIGLFINTIPVRIKCDGNESFHRLMQQVQQAALEAEPYHYLPLAEIQAKTELKQELLDHLIIFENYPLEQEIAESNSQEPGLEIAGVDVFEQTPYDFNVIAGLGKELSIQLEFNGLVYDVDLAGRIERHFKEIARTVVAGADVLVNQIGLLSREEKWQILNDFNDTLTPYPQDMTIHRLFEEQAGRIPDNIALVYEDQSLTYRELNRKANQMAESLRERGVKPGQTVAIMAGRSLEMIIGIMGILKAGGAYLPIDPKYPGERIRYMLRDSGAEVLLIDNGQLTIDNGKATAIVNLNDRNIYRGEGSNLEGVNQPGDLAYVIYTSGSTGRPKGVMIEHRSVINLVAGLDKIIYQRYDGVLKVALVAPYIFDASVQQIFASLLLGHQLHIVPEEARLSGKDLLEYYHRYSIDISDGTPVHLKLLAETSARLAESIGVKHLIIGGETLPVTYVTEFLKWFPASQPEITNIYGPTECCVDSTAYLIDPGELNELTSIPIGSPLANQMVYILGRDLQLLPTGVPGELYITGPGLARGYLNQPELTAERFVPNPFVISDFGFQISEFKNPQSAIGNPQLNISQSMDFNPQSAIYNPQWDTPQSAIRNPQLITPQLRMYRTGDLARWLPDGNIEFLGRSDDQVKIRGFRIELGEIENQLLKYPSIQAVKVIAKEDRQGGKYLVAYWVGEKELTPGEIRERLLKELPDYMVPSYFIRLERMPLTPSGKIDRKALPEPDAGNTGADYVAPADETEVKLVRLWREILDLERVGTGDNFFELGGHSLKATVLVSRIHQEFNVDLPLREVFRTPTVAGIAQYLKEAKARIYFSIQPVAEREYYPVSSAQKRLYILDQLEQAGTAYNMPDVMMVEGKIDRVRFKAAFRELIQRHESLRTSFEMVEGELRQRIHPEVEFEYEQMAYGDGQMANGIWHMADRDEPIADGDKHMAYGISHIADDEEHMEMEDGGGHPVNSLGGINHNANVMHSVPEGTVTDAISHKPYAISHKQYAISHKVIHDFIRPFDLSFAPLLRISLAKLKEDRQLLMFDMHHIISDGVSMEILVREFTSLYAGKQLEPLKIQYKDYVVWQKELSDKGAFKKQEEYWLELFKEEIPVLNLPLDYPRPAVRSFAGDRISFEISGALTGKLHQVARDYGATLYMVLLAGYTALLFRYTGQEDIVAGSPIAGRPHADLQKIIGMFVNTLAMRNYPQGEKTFGEFLKDVTANALRAYENQDYPLEELVEKLNLRGDMSRNVLFDTMFTLQNIDVNGLELEGLKIKPYPREFKIAKFDLTLSATEAENRISFELEYCTKLFKPETVERMAGHFVNLLERVVDRVEIQLQAIEILSVEEKKQILFDFNDTMAEYPKGKTIQELFEEQVERTSNQIAVIFEDEQLTYGELNEKANRLARVLRDQGVKPDEIVSIMVERSLEMIIGILGILKSGGAYLPIDPNYPLDRISYMLADSGTKILLTQTSLKHQVEFAGETIKLDDQGICRGDGANLNQVNSPANLAYLIYTSGTTGKPKGAMIEHRNVVRLMINNRMPFDFNADDVWTIFHSYCFDFSVWEMYGALLYGGKLIVVPKLTAQDPKGYLQLLKNFKVTVLNQTPTAFYHLSNEELQTFEKGLNLRYVVFGGEALKPVMLKGFREKYPATKLINMYGITETTVHVTYKEITEPEINANLSNIGVPIPTLTTYVLDRNLKLLPIGAKGELFVGGDGVGRGYLNRPELTAERFVPNPFQRNCGLQIADCGLQDSGLKASDSTCPFTDSPIHRLPHSSFPLMYKTGDLVRWLPDGNLEFVGRIDHQVKIRGYRIELGEIENRLLQHDSVKETVVIARDDASGGKYLVAYVAGEKAFTTAGLREHLSKDLPDYMVPSYFIKLDRLPLTPNGKVDQKALPEPDDRISTGVVYEAPSNETERKLLAIWREILQIEKIGIHDSFFDLGGHSLKATALVAKIHQVLQIELPLREVFHSPTIKELAGQIQAAVTSKYYSIQPVPAREYYPVSYAQKRMYTLQMMEGAQISYNMLDAVIIEGNPDRKKMESVFKSLIERHEAFRTTFELIGGEPVQKIHQSANFWIHYLEATEEEIKDLVREFPKPFDLSKAPLLRASLVKLQAEKHLFLLDMHHIISDGMSLGILVKEFAALYDGVKLPALRIQYKDFSEWQHELFQTNKIKRQEEYWLNQFAGEVSTLNIPTDYPRPAVMNFEGGWRHFEFDRELTAKLKQLALQKGTTMFITLLAAYNVLLARLSGQEDVIVGTPVAGRRHADLENIIGVFLNILALRNYPRLDRTFMEFLDEVKENTLQAFENQDYQFEMLLDQLKVKRDFSRNPLFDTVLNYLNLSITGGEPEINHNGLKYTPYGDIKTAKFDIAFNFSEVGEKIVIDCNYRTSLFESSTIEYLTGEYIRLLEAVVLEPHRSLKDYEIFKRENIGMGGNKVKVGRKLS
jgi:amino acid adenylation domain-containing protein